MIKLKSLELIPKGQDGWKSGKLEFGEKVTIAHGDNTTGKTPLLKSIVYALGFPASIPKLVQEHCLSVRLKLEKGTSSLTIERYIKDEFHVVVRSESGERSFLSADEMSGYIFEMLELSRVQLTTKMGAGSAYPYVDNLFPLFWVDQDFGWTDIYRTIKNKDFLKSSKQEMIRLILGLSPKYPFIDKSVHEAAKDTLKATKEALKIKKKVLTELKIQKTVADIKKKESFETKRSQIKSELQKLDDQLISFRNDNSYVLAKAAEYETDARKIDFEVATLQSRRESLIGEITDLDSEISILSDNVVVSKAFQEFCEAEHCKVFKKESFGKKLLYLKDQKKDILLVIKTIDLDIDSLKNKQILERKKSEDLRSEISKKDNMGTLQVASKQLVGDLVEIESFLANYKRSEAILEEFNNLLNKVETSKQDVLDTKPSGRAKRSNSLDEALKKLNECIIAWLKVLDFDFNEAHIDENFELFIDGTQFKDASEESGSSRQRVVLAFYASLVETSFNLNGLHPGILVFDGIVQHELKLDDLKRYLDKLNALEDEYKKSVQIIFSITAKEFDLDVTGKKIWEPKFKILNKDGEEKLMYLGPISK